MDEELTESCRHCPHVYQCLWECTTRYGPPWFLVLPSVPSNGLWLDRIQLWSRKDVRGLCPPSMTGDLDHCLPVNGMDC